MKNKKIYKIFLVPIILATFISLNIANVFAATFTVSASTSSVSPGGTFNVTIKVPGAGKFSISASNGTVSSSQAFVDGSYSFSVKAGKSGTTTVSVSARDVTGNDESTVTGTKSVSVKIKTSSSGGNTGGSNGGSTGGNSSGNTSGNTGGNTGSNSSGSSGNTTTDNRSKENSLESLSVSSGTLSPSFSASTTSYKVDLTNDVTKLTINAKAKDSKAKVSGTGEKELKIGENNFVVTVVAENGSKKTYTISAYVTEKATQFVKFSDKDYGILTDFSKVDLPKGYSPTTVKVDGKEVAALKNEITGLTLLYLQAPDGKTGFYIYENDSVVGEFQTISVNQKVYVIFNDKNVVKDIVGIKESKIKISDLELQGWSFDDKKLANYSLVYLMNENGEKGLYMYESSEGTLQKYIPTSTSSNNTLMYVFISTTALFAVTTVAAAMMYLNFKKKSISSIKDYYDNKNQGE